MTAGSGGGGSVSTGGGGSVSTGGAAPGGAATGGAVRRGATVGSGTTTSTVGGAIRQFGVDGGWMSGYSVVGVVDEVTATTSGCNTLVSSGAPLKGGSS